MLRLLDFEFCDELDYILDGKEKIKLTKPRSISLATGAASYEQMKRLCALAESKIDGLRVNVYRIRNEFFGESVTVSGLLTGIDLEKQLKGQALGEELLLPATTLRAEGDLFLCGMTPEILSEKLGGIKITFCKNDGAELLSSITGQENC